MENGGEMLFIIGRGYGPDGGCEKSEKNFLRKWRNMGNLSKLLLCLLCRII